MIQVLVHSEGSLIVAIILISILQMKKLTPRDMKLVGQGHIAIG